MTKSKKKIILLTTSLILTICLMAFFGVYALTTLKNSTFNVGVKYEPEYLVKVEMGIDGANGGTDDKIIEDKEYVEIFNSSTPVSNGMYIQSMSNDTIHINSQTLKPIGENGEVHFKITSLENETSGNKDLKCVINCGNSTADSGTMASGEISNLTIATGINATSGTATSSSLGMIKINLKFSEVLLLDLKYLVGNDETGIDLGRAGKIETNVISGTTFYVSNIDGLLNLSALVGKVDTTTTEYGSNYGYNNSAGPVVTFSGATITMLNNIDCENGNNKNNFSKKFIPIGNSSTNSFQGTFDGNNKTITGLYINQRTDNAGLFGYVSNAEDVSNAEIKNLTMQNCKVVSRGEHVGNFVGIAKNNLTISNCSAEETEVSGDFAGKRVGGIVGGVDGTTTITNCYNTGSVSGDDNYVGGIVGYVWETTTITNCYNTGSVGGDSSVGGIVGIVGSAAGLATITNCYNTGDVSGTESVSGIVGGVWKTATITNCYNTGSVSGDSEIGGIVGYIYSNGTTTITNCYYLKTSSVNASLNGVGVNDGTLTSTSYFGTFSSATSNVVKTSSANLVYSGNILDVLNAYRNANPTYNGIDLKSWVDGSNGYPVFAL